MIKPTQHKAQVHAFAIKQLLYGLCVCKEDNPLAKARGLSSVQTHKLYANARGLSSFRTDAQTIH